MSETMLRTADGAQLCAEVIGTTGPFVVLIAGAAMSMDGWDPELCGLIAGAGRRVVRYDHRDTGRSTLYPPGAPGYTAQDLTGDAVTVIEQVAGGRAHVVGLSMGGAIAQSVAVHRPDLVASLTLIDTSPSGPGPDNGLPPMADELRAAFADPAPDPDWSDLDAVTGHLARQELLFAGAGHVDEARSRAASRRAAERTPNHMASASNHFVAPGGEDPRPRLGEITTPALIVHGTADLLFAPGHALALAREIPGARLVWLEDGGHATPAPWHWPVLLAALLPHTAA